MTRRAPFAALTLAAVMALTSLGLIATADRAEAATFKFVTVTKQMGRDYCWNLYRGQVVTWRYLGMGYWEATCVGHALE